MNRSGTISLMEEWERHYRSRAVFMREKTPLSFWLGTHDAAGLKGATEAQPQSGERRIWL